MRNAKSISINEPRHWRHLPRALGQYSAPLLLTLAVLAGAGCGRGRHAAAGAAPGAAINVRVMAAETRPFERRFAVQGTIEAKVFANVAARVAGNLDALWVDEGDAVVAGETPLFQIDPVALSNAVTVAAQSHKVAEAGLAVARAALEKVNAEAAKARLDFARFARLHKEGKVSDNEYETADTRNRQALAGIAMAEAQVALMQSQAGQAAAALQIARKNLADSLVLAPISGVVSRRNAEPGEQMAVGRTVVTIMDLDSLEAAAFVPAQYYGDVVPGETVFRLAVGGRDSGECRVYYRSPTINPTLRTFEIKGRLDKAAAAAGAVPGAMADLTLVFERRSGLAVPGASVLTRAGQPVVFTARERKAHQRVVVTGWQNDGLTEILKGLDAGEMVVYEGQALLRDGMPVEVR